MEDSFFDVPAGYSDADIEQAQFEAAGRAIARARREGRCAHGARQGYAPGYSRGLSPGQERCHECGKVTTREALDAERDAIVSA